MSVSVVIPTRDRPAALAACLRALAAQEGAGELDVVIVDDGSRDRAAVAEAVAGARPSHRLLRSPGRGPATARNLGARATQADVVCFLDDDCEPAPRWAAALAAAARAAGAAAGRTVAPPGAPAAVAASQAITEHLTLASLDRATGRLGFAPSCNLALAREAIDRLPFDESVPGAAGEDRDWSHRADGAGLAPVYVPEAVVVHRQELGPAGFARQQYRYGRGAAGYRAAAPGRALARPGFYARLVRRGFDGGVAAGTLVVAAQALTAAGVGAERIRSGAAAARRAGRAGPRR
jgi:glycosyltransferase involved in cell wall biosynthesis